LLFLLTEAQRVGGDARSSLLLSLGRSLPFLPPSLSTFPPFVFAHAYRSAHVLKCGRHGLQEYVDADNVKQQPIMIHRAIFGSLERFFGILIENYAGETPEFLLTGHTIYPHVQRCNTESHSRYFGSILPFC
jgi:hypothetical protein